MATPEHDASNIRSRGIFIIDEASIQENFDTFWGPDWADLAATDVAAYANNLQWHVFQNKKQHQAKEPARTVQNDGPNFRKWPERSPVLPNPKDKEFPGSNNEFKLVANMSSFDVAQYPDSPQRAGMSFIHVLGVPMARIFNGVALNKSNVRILQDIIDAFTAQWQTSKFREEVIQYQKVVIENTHRRQLECLGPEEETKKKRIEENYHKALGHFEELEPKAYKLEAGDFSFGLHLYPDHSVNHLHLHIIAGPPEFRAYSTRMHEEKTMDVRAVQQFIMSDGFPDYQPSNRSV
ncbi:uncharacterized protein JN550_002959 [Neoarthrinium moseri]|uniref:uncharacterized protein n=1 Tax=Neoarthrinium moseri TaxID=1658444 RepID=UPI001FDC6E8E|nr:uncharacterized protein JN550_002959 [Neoarthrinium moseri]KAI1873690.1 hypothetical protein JN550_002959 [Neoarthrinium moseri]